VHRALLAVIHGERCFNLRDQFVVLRDGWFETACGRATARFRIAFLPRYARSQPDIDFMRRPL
jgi:hypothetical protein